MRPQYDDKSKNRLNVPAISYIPPLLIFIVSQFILWYIFIWNEPFWQGTDASLPAGQAAGAAWLFTIKDMGGHSEGYSKRADYSSNDDADDGGEGADAGRGLIKYGFGVWGWCEWGDSSTELEGRASCYGGGAWSVPASAGKESQVEELGLPSAIAKSLFPCAIFILIPVIVTAFCAIAMLISFKYPRRSGDGPVAPARSWSYSQMYDDWRSYANVAVRYQCACIMLAWRTAVISVFLILLGTLPALIAVAIGKAHYEGPRGRAYSAKIGKGGYLLVGVILMNIVAFLWIALVRPIGLWPHKRKYLIPAK